MRSTTLALTAALLAGCASYQPAVDDAPFARASDTLWRVNIAAMSQCESYAAPNLGSFMRRTGDKVLVVHVVPGGAAQAAGLRDGDLVIAYDGATPGHGNSGARVGVPLSITFERSAHVMNTSVVPVASCNFQIKYTVTDRVDGQAQGLYNSDGSVNGTTVLVSRGLVNATTDTQLYFVEAHEVCHLLADNQDHKLHTGPAAEIAADRCAIRLMAQDHVDASGIPEFVQRMQNNAGVLANLLDALHPPTAERIAALKADIGEAEAARK